MSLFVIRYGELGLKSTKVRRRFEKALKRNIEDAFLKENVQCLTELEWGRIYIHTESDDKAKMILARIMGITSFSLVKESTSKMDDISKIVSEYSIPRVKKNSSFAVRANRTGEHKFTSQDVAREAGSAILEANKGKEISVDLKNPDIEIFIEVRHQRSFIFSEKIRGPGGFPKGTQGKVLAVISDKKSIYAAWLMLKRGCSVKSFCLSEEAVKFSQRLESWYMNSKPILARESENQIQNALDYAKIINADAIVMGHTFSEFRKEDKAKAQIPIFYPLIGMSEGEIEGKITSLFDDDF